MRPSAAACSFSIGWDVGGWNCDKNGKSRDALVILDATLAMVGQPWRGNLRECIAAATTTTDWLRALFAKCQAELPVEAVAVTMAATAGTGGMKKVTGTSSAVAMVAVSPGIAPTNKP